MNEADWLACDDPDRMLEVVHRRATVRKFRLVSVGGCRQIWRLIHDVGRRLVEVVEANADGPASGLKVRRAEREVRAVVSMLRSTANVTMTRSSFVARDAAMAAMAAADVPGDPRRVLGLARAAVAASTMPTPDQCSLIRCLFGSPPFRPLPIDPAWLAARDGLVPDLSRGIYDDRAFERLPILADALEEAGCDDADILGHCRAPGEHYRGCWVVDALLGMA